MKQTSASPCSRALAASLREARDARRLGLRELARVLDLDPQMLSQWERGLRVPSIEVVARILGYLQVNREATESILFLARHARDSNWIDAKPSDLPPYLSGVIEYERSAIRITYWSLTIIPGLMQTADYARALLGDSQISLEDADKRLSVRLTRQKVLAKSDPVQVNAIIRETVIHEQVGNEDIMSDQVDRLLEIADLKHVSLRILPAQLGYHPGLIGPFTMYEFVDRSPILLLEHHHASAHLYDDEGIARYRKLTKLLAGKALSEDASRALLLEAAR